MIGGSPVKYQTHTRKQAEAAYVNNNTQSSGGDSQGGEVGGVLWLIGWFLLLTAPALAPFWIVVAELFGGYRVISNLTGINISAVSGWYAFGLCVAVLTANLYLLLWVLRLLPTWVVVILGIVQCGAGPSIWIFQNAHPESTADFILGMVFAIVGSGVGAYYGRSISRFFRVPYVPESD